jgi:hypothetical protein
MMSRSFRLVVLLTLLSVWLSPLPPSLASPAAPLPEASVAQAVQALEPTAPAIQPPTPSPHGPQRTTYEGGIPRHAYSPFNEVKEATCPPGGCDTQPGVMLVKLAPQVRLQTTEGLARTDAASLNTLLDKYQISRVEPIFPRARPPQAGEIVIAPTGEPLPKPDLTRWLKVRVPGDQKALDAALEAFRADPSVAVAEPDYLRKPVGEPSPSQGEGWGEGPSPSPSQGEGWGEGSPLALPGPGTDPLYGQQWHLGATNVPTAWQWLEDHSLPPGGSRDIVVAVIDTGVDYTHPDLAANMWVNPPEFGGTPGVDDDGNGYVDDIYGADTVTPDGNPLDDHGHGTHVAGIIAAQADNGVGGVGVAYNVQIMALKAAQYSGVLASSDIAEAVYYAVEKGADVINMSFGGYVRSQVEEDALAVAFGSAVLVAAAGNDGYVNLPCPFGQDMYPAAYNWVLGVMASTSGGGRAGFSNYDCMPHDSHEYELLAPGVDVWSTLSNSQYAAWDGTSMAAPIVSGIAALARTRWSDKDVYSSRFIMGQIASNASPVADAYAALTAAPQPELSYLEHWLFDTEEQSPDNDDDGIVDAGETVDLAIVIRNHWGKADPVTATLEAWAEGAVFPDPYVTMITGTVDYGAVGSFNVDDNGLIYDDEGMITGVRHPFRFSVDTDTPNDHVIPFRMTMIAHNGLDPADTTVYTFQSRFYLIVQRGRELPRIISQDMVLTKDYYWIVPEQTLIETGVTVTVTEGTEVQWGAPDPNDPYSEPPMAYIQAEGTFLARGTSNEPIELFPSPVVRGGQDLVSVQTADGATTDLEYLKVRNPCIGVGTYTQADRLDHAYFDGERSGSISSHYLTNSIVHKIPYMEHTIQSHCLWTCLLDNLGIGLGYYGVESILDTVFLQDNQDDRAMSLTLMYWKDNELEASQDTYYIRNAFLSRYWDPNVSHWMRVDHNYYRGRDSYFGVANNFWGTTSTTLIDASIIDFNDDFNKAHIVYQPILTTPATTTYPFVVDVLLSTAAYSNSSALHGPTPIVGAEQVTFTVTFNRDMDTSVQPSVSFGPDVPETDYTIHPVEGGWVDPRTWVGTFNITPITGDGYQLMRIAGPGRAADDPWLVIGDDVERFRFEIITSGTEAMNLQATGGEGYADLMWTQDDFDLLAGFNLYRATTQGGPYSRLNTSIIPPDQRAYQDTDVQPGQPYYYKFTIVKSDMSESDFSNVTQATPVDTIPPVISHTPITEAPPGLPLTLLADVTDNVGVQSVTLSYRLIGGTQYTAKAMVHTTGNRYSATVAGSQMTSPGIEYYIEASDGVSTVRKGRPDYPYQVTVEDRPVVTMVSPDHGPTSGGTPVTISGSNFKAGATVTFGGAVASDVTVVSSSQITCTTPPHFPETVDVTVTNPDTQSGTLLRAFTYQSTVAQLGLPDTGGGQHAVVQVPVNAANVQGLAAASLTITFDPAVLDAQGAATGNLTPGWSLTANTNTPGQIRLSMASPGGTATGSGVLAHLEFEVVGSPGMTSTLHLASVSLNDGAIPTETADGSFAVSVVYDVSGRVGFWNGGAGVPGVQLTLAGDRVYAGLSGGDGTYTVGGAAAGDYVLTPSKSDTVNGITAYDASLALQHDAWFITLSGHQAMAADVNKSGAITAMDAFYILQKAVELIVLPFPGAGVVWDFDPPSRSYPALSSDQTGQDFTGVLLGDVSGNWSAGGGQSLAAAAAGPVVVRVQGGHPDASGVVTATVTLEPQGASAYGLDLNLAYDPAVATPLAVGLGPVAEGWMLSANLEQPGQVLMALAGAEPLVNDGELLTMTFQMAAPSGGSTALTWTRGEVNEGTVPITLVDGRLGRWEVYLPLVLRSSSALSADW